MGHILTCYSSSIYPTSTPVENNPNSLERHESNLSTHCLRDRVHKSKKSENEDPQQLRLKLLHEIPFSFNDYTIIIIYAPPEFRIHDVSQFISKKVSLPLIEASTSASEASLDEDYEQAIMESLTHSQKFPRGFIVINYPTIPKQLQKLKSIFPEARIVPIFLDLDSETMRVLRDKFDRWVHTNSERSYHAVTRPPHSLEGKHVLPTDANMLDDDTGEPLVHLKSDTFEAYKEKFAKYRLAETLIKSCYESIFTIPSCSTKKELYEHLLKTLAHAAVRPPLEQSQEDPSGEGKIRKLPKLPSNTSDYR